MKSDIGTYAITKEEVIALKNYIKRNKLYNSYPIEKVDTYLWVLLDEEYVRRYQTIKNYEGQDLARIKNRYFTFSAYNIPFFAYENPDNYPEYFL